MKSITTILLCILLIMCMLRIGITYANPTGHLQMPEWTFAYSYLGRDLQDYTIRPAYEISAGKTPFVFGYGSVFVAALSIRAAETFGLCQPSLPDACGLLLYRTTVILSIFSFLFILFAAIKNQKDRTIALIFFITFLLGIPMNKALESGNIDLLLAPGIGFVLLYLRRITKMTKNHPIPYIALGCIGGILLNSKGFMVPFVLIMLLGTKMNVFGLATFAGSFAISALWPWLFNVRSGLWDVFSFSLRGSTIMNEQLFTHINYGNNSLFAYISNVVQTIASHTISDNISHLLIWIIYMLCIYLIILKPWIDEQVKPARVLSFSSSYTLLLVLFTTSYTVILTLLAWSYDYRICYSIPIVFFLIAEAHDTKSRTLLYMAIICLLIKSLWIPKDRIMTIFLYIHLYFIMRAALSIWQYGRQKGKRFV
jgi:hypothetical protein